MESQKDRERIANGYPFAIRYLSFYDPILYLSILDFRVLLTLPPRRQSLGHVLQRLSVEVDHLYNPAADEAAACQLQKQQHQLLPLC